jgi:CBS domain
MLVRDVMTSPVVSVQPTTPVRGAAALLTERGFTALPVVSDDAELVGIGRRASLSTLTRADVAIATDVRRRVKAYAKLGRWGVAVRSGVVTLTGSMGFPTEQHVGHGDGRVGARRRRRPGGPDGGLAGRSSLAAEGFRPCTTTATARNVRGQVQ